VGSVHQPPAKSPRDHAHRVPADRVFFLGDNTDNSNDSREIGGILLSKLVGPVIFRIWPPRRVGGVR
jgi:signal peptidase I